MSARRALFTETQSPLPAWPVCRSGLPFCLGTKASTSIPQPIPGGQLLMPVRNLVLWQGEDTTGCWPHPPAAQEWQGQPELLAGAAAPSPGAAQ